MTRWNSSQQPGREQEVTPEGSGLRVQGSAFIGRGLTAGGAWVVLACLIVGCGGPPEPKGNPAGPSKAGPDSAAADSTPRDRAAPPRTTRDADARNESKPDRPASRPPGESAPEEELEDDAAPDQWPEPQRVRSLADLLDAPDAASDAVPGFPRLEVDEARAAAAGIRKVAGERLTLYTDLPPDEEVDVLPEVFRQAFPQWCKYFGIDPADQAGWKMTGFLMKDKEALQRAGLFPDALPPFDHGFSWNYEFWVYEQPSAYYRRHLVLHEGTHSFMNTVLRGCGPPWYMEGIAELLGTHRWHQGRLTMNHMPATREEVPMWGRIKIIQDDYAAHRAKTLQSVLEYPPRAHLQTEPYAWCWAAAALLDGHPRYRERFRQLPRLVLAPDFSARFQRLIGDDWDALAEEWQLFVADVEYGHDIAKTAVDFTPGQPLAEAGTSVRVAADRGWQSSGLLLKGGVTYRIRASGRYQVADQPQIWWCEPGGVSIRYYKGRPLGILLAAVRPEPPRPGEPSALIRPIAVGLGTTLTPEHTGTLFLRVNDSAAELDDNAGTLAVYIRAESGA